MATVRPCSKSGKHMPHYYYDDGVSCYCPGVD